MNEKQMKDLMNSLEEARRDAAETIIHISKYINAKIKPEGIEAAERMKKWIMRIKRKTFPKVSGNIEDLFLWELSRTLGYYEALLHLSKLIQKKTNRKK